MHRPKAALAVLSFAFAFTSPFASATYAQKRGLLPQDYYKEVEVREVAVSPAGTAVAFTVTTSVEKDNKRHQEIWIQRLESGAPAGAPYRLTDPTVDSRAPRWSPDESLLAFTSKRGKDSNTTWFLRLKAPGGEAFHIEGVGGAPVWSPDSKWIAFVKAPGDTGAEETEKKDPREGWIAPDAFSTTLDPKRFDGRVVTSTRYKEDGVLELKPHFSIRRKNQLFVVPAEGGAARQLTSLAFDVSEVTWSKDGRFLFFTGNERQDDELSRELTEDIYAIAKDGGEPRRMTQNPGSERAPAVSPAGDRLTYLRTAERGAETDLMISDLTPDGTLRGEPKNLTSTWDLTPSRPEWAPDGKAIRFEVGVTGNQHLYEAALDGTVRPVTKGDRTLASFSSSKDGELMAFSGTDPMSPAELFIAKGDGSGERRLTSFNDNWLTELALVRPERLTWKVKDGSTIEGWLVKPVGYEPGRKYPFVLKIHGGPHGAYGNTWFGTFHILSGAGFFVLYTNPRGSTGYGHRFTYATRGQWGVLDSEDYLGGVDTALTRYKDIDPKRLGVSGGSYGGFMTFWLTATSNRFAAAVSSRAIANWESWYGSSDAQGHTEYEFFGTPWEQRELYRKLSPISYVEKVTAPTLVIEGEQDYRTPMAEGEAWFMALEKRQVPVELVRYPRSSHGLSRTGEPWLLVDRLERIRSWFVHWLIEKPAATTTAGRP